MKFIPLNDRIWLKREDAEEKSTGGIIIPSNAQEKPMKAKVVAVGNGRITESGKILPLEVKKGQIVFFRKFAGTDITVENVEYLILREDEILAIVE